MSVPVTVAEARYKDVHSIVLEDDVLQITVVPGCGAKIASLINRRTGHECLYQLPGAIFRKVGYGAPYNRGEAAGWDEMFPTIGECYCDAEPWAGVKMPDHGEVWSVPWQVEPIQLGIRVSVHGVRFPYRLTRTITLDRPGVLLLRYRAENLCACDLPAMWAAHPLFNVTAGTRIILPESARDIFSTTACPALGEYGARYTFPVAATARGTRWDMSRIHENGGVHYFNYSFTDNLQEGFAILHDPATRETVALAWPVDQVPYLNVWVSEGAWEGQYNMSLQPCTAPLDRWDVARQWGKLPVIPAHGSLEWELRATAGLWDDPRRVEPDGTIVSSQR